VDTTDLVIVLSVVAGGLLFTSIAFAIAWVRARERAYRADVAAGGASRGLDPDVMGHLQRTVDSVALEVERIGESQRFLTRLATERDADLLSRGDRPALAPTGRVITPH
jgi:hypothetical protein